MIRWLPFGKSRSQQEIKQFTPALYEECHVLLLSSSSFLFLLFLLLLLYSKYGFPFWGCEVLTASLVQLKVFWYVILCRYIYSCWHFGGACCLQVSCSQTLKMEVECSFRMLVPVLPGCMESHPWRLCSSQLLLWEPHILPNFLYLQVRCNFLTHSLHCFWN
jgi:hypothetical protein